MVRRMSLRAVSKSAAVLLAALALPACAGSSMSDWINGKPKPVEANIAPTDYKLEIIATVQRTLDDPSNIREASLSDPQLQTFGTEQRYVACVRFNARDFTKRYVGAKDYLVYFFGGHLNQMIAATPEQCARAAYKPFPELEKLCAREKCT
jgi:hypothetical protein